MRLAILIAIATVASAAEPLTKAPLFERLGGMPAVNAVIDGFVARIVDDARVSRWFAHTKADPERYAAYRKQLATLVCQSTGGPCRYEGMDMLAAHKGRKITSEAFDAVVEDLVATLDALKVPAAEKAELLGILGPLKPLVVGQ